MQAYLLSFMALFLIGEHPIQNSNPFTVLYAQEVKLIPVHSDTLSNAQVRSLLRTQDGSVWIGTRENGIYIQKDTELFRLEGEEKSPGGAISIGEDEAGSLWFAARSLWKLSGETLMEYPQTLTGNRINFSVRPAGGGSVWVGGSAGALKISRDEIARYGVEEGLKHPVVHDILQQDDRTTWFATRRGGLNKLEGADWSYFLPEVNCRKLMPTRSGALLIGTSEGLLSFDPMTNREMWLQREDIALLPEFEDDQGNIWCSTEGHGIWVWSNDTWEKKQPANLKTDVIYSMILVDGEVWVGTDGGVVRFQIFEN